MAVLMILLLCRGFAFFFFVNCIFPYNNFSLRLLEIRSHDFYLNAGVAFLSETQLRASASSHSDMSMPEPCAAAWYMNSIAYDM